MKRFSLRLPEEVLERVTADAALERRSINNHILWIIECHYIDLDNERMEANEKLARSTSAGQAHYVQT